MLFEDEAASVADLEIYSLGRTRYQDVWDFQKRLQQELIAGHGKDSIIICEHEPVITLGRAGSTENILLPLEQVKERGVEVFETERGGDVTYHGPGQLVAYPVIDLSRKRRDVGWYMRSLEETIILSLKEYGIEGFRIAGRTGVWTLTTENDKENEPRKIASLGVRISRWCTLHGFSLNVFSCRDGFSLINPCGFRDVSVSAISELRTAPVELGSVEMSLLRNFIQVFGFHGS